MGWFSDFVSNPIGTLGDTGQSIIDTVKEHPIETAAIAAGGYYGATALAGSEAMATTAAVSEGAVTATELGSLEASTAGLSGIDLGGVGGSPATWTNATSAGISNYSTSGWTAGQIASAVSSGLNLATSAVKLGTVSKMNSSTPTTSGLLNSLGTGPSTVVTTPNGPEAVATQAIGATTAQPSQGMDTQTIFVIAAAAAAIWFILKKG
jgi:hypothetical protein